MQENIWGPLGMTSTTFQPQKRTDFPARAVAMSFKSPEGHILPIPHLYTEPNEFEPGGHGCYSTPADYLKFQTALLQDGGPILTKASIDEMFRPQLPDRQKWYVSL